METLKYKIIKNKKQYNDYCNILEELAFSKTKNKTVKEEIELLTLLIEKWDSEHNTFAEADPIELLKYLMDENNLKAVDLVEILGVSKGLISDILNYKKGLSKEIIRKLAERFKLNHDAFNRPYKLELSKSNLRQNENLKKEKRELVRVR
ncbi:MAG: helix-turn-helix domain-containing protein [Bacteroidia bacterium]